MSYDRMPLTKLTGGIYRSTQAYLNEVLEKYQLGSGTYPFLLTLYRKEGINQNQISRDLDIDKAMSARTIKKLVDLGYIRKEPDLLDSRAYLLFLTEKGRMIIPDIKRESEIWTDIITRSLDDTNKKKLLELLEIVFHETKHYRNKQKVEE